MGLAICPEGTLSESWLGEYGLMVLCSTWWSGEVGASSEQPASAHLLIHTHTGTFVPSPLTSPTAGMYLGR